MGATGESLAGREQAVHSIASNSWPANRNFIPVWLTISSISLVMARLTPLGGMTQAECWVLRPKMGARMGEAPV